MTNVYTPKSTAQVRAAVKTIFGAANARVTRNGEIHVCGTMPNTNERGWYLLGFVGQADVEDRVWWPDGSLNYSLAR